MTVNWLRKTSATIGSVQINDLDIHFKIDSTKAESAAATATIKIYNLSQATASRIQPGDKVTLTAGYQDNNGMIYLGRVKSISTGRDGGDTYTEISCVDYTWSTEMPTRSYPKGTPINQMIRQLYADALLPAGPIITDHGITCSDAYTTDPNGKTTLDQLLAMINGVEEIFKNKLTVHHAIIAGAANTIADNQTLPETYILAAETGLLSTAQITDDTTDQEATCLLLWGVQVDTIIWINTKTTKAKYKVVSYRHTADDNQYQTEMSLKLI